MPSIKSVTDAYRPGLIKFKDAFKNSNEKHSHLLSKSEICDERFRRQKEDMINMITIPNSVMDCLINKLQMSYEKARQYIDEYKKFLMMAACSDCIAGVTPSRQVEHVWLIHLSHNDNYMNIIKILMGTKRFDHVPTLGGTV